MPRLVSVAKIEIGSNELARMKYFANINLKSAYNQIEIETAYKEITTIKTLIVLLKLIHHPFGIKPVRHIFQKVILEFDLGR